MANDEDIKTTLKADYNQFNAVVSQLPEELKSKLSNYEDRETLIAALKQQRDEYDQIMEQLRNNPDMRTVEYAQRALSQGMGVFSGEDNTVSVDVNTTGNDQVRSNLIHEFKHKDFHNSKVNSLPMSLEQTYKVGMYNEIAANMASLIQQRQEYKAAATDEERQKVLEKINNTSYGFYAKAIKNGEINPLSDTPEDFKKEMEFMFHGVQDTWMSTYSDGYKQQNTNECINAFLTHTYDELKTNDENFNLARKTAFTLGGFDFSQFQDSNSVKCCSQPVMEADKAINDNASRTVIYNYLIEESTLMSSFSSPVSAEVPEVRTDMSLSQQYELGLYQAIAEDIKEKRRMSQLLSINIPLKDQLETSTLGSDITKYSQELASKLLTSDISPEANNRKYKEELKKICTIDGVNIAPLIKKLQKKTEIPLEKAMNRYGGVIKNSENLSLEEREEKLQETLFTPKKWSQNQATEKDRNFTLQSNFYYGAPKYKDDGKIETRSDILDLTKPVLQNELTAREMKAAVNNALTQLNSNQAEITVPTKPQEKDAKNTANKTKKRSTVKIPINRARQQGR